jgi:hypothetical protein
VFSTEPWREQALDLVGALDRLEERAQRPRGAARRYRERTGPTTTVAPMPHLARRRSCRVRAVKR